MSVIKVVKPFCHICGKECNKVIAIRVTCPICTVDVNVQLCKDCAKKLVDKISELLKEIGD